MMIRTTQINKSYQFSAYKKGWIFEVMKDYGDFYTAKLLTGEQHITNNVIAVHKNDCESLNKTL